MGLQAQYNKEQAKYSTELSKEMWDKAGTVVYTLKCNGNDCKVSDVRDSDGSLKNNLLRECR